MQSRWVDASPFVETNLYRLSLSDNDLHWLVFLYEIPGQIWSRKGFTKPTLRSCQREADFPSIDELRSWRGRRGGSWGKLWKIKQRNQEMIYMHAYYHMHTYAYIHALQTGRHTHIWHTFTLHTRLQTTEVIVGVTKLRLISSRSREPWLSSNCGSVNRCLKTLPRPTAFLWNLFHKPHVLCVRTDVQEWSEIRCWRSEAEGIQCSSHLTEHVLCYSKLYMEWFRKSWVVIFLALTCVYIFIYCTFSRCLRQ